MVSAHPHPTPVNRACTACAGPVAEELWFYGHDERQGGRIVAALTGTGLPVTAEDSYIKAPVAGEVVPVLDRVAGALSEAERAMERVAWIIAGTSPTRAVSEGLTLQAVTDSYTGNVSAPRDAILAVGGLDEDLDYAEDIELGYRLAAAGQPFVYAPEARGYARNPKAARALLHDFYRLGQGNVHVYHKLPATLSSLPLGAYGETNLRLRLARGLLLRLAENRAAARLLDEGFALWASAGPECGARQLFELARGYYFWRGVRGAVREPAEWRRLASPGVPILLYHSVQRSGHPTLGRFTISAPRFTQQMMMLKLLGYRVVSLDALVDRWDTARPPAPRSAAITFDDGYWDNLDQAWPVLRRFNYPATVFIVSGHVGGRSEWDATAAAGTSPLLTWEQVRWLDGAGFRAAAHSVSHPRLTEMDLPMAAAEIAGARRDLEERLEHPVGLFAYPYGRLNEDLQEQVARAGYRAAFSVQPGLNTPCTARFARRRIDIRGNDSLVVFILKLWIGDNPLRWLPWSRYQQRGQRRRSTS